ncbi:AFH_G0023300.mRNA.1.CDS.1 [Saccharomyces cerevisiae]|nr:AFH_G0023300.mRNA.1.CDS.1 [Saccharomyces cerevisiae]CAI6726299.1 AFH_G0023300.mRNA.1.CDS.1 [Saccharomyces cerevisiae]
MAGGPLAPISLFLWMTSPYPADINLNEEHCFNDSNDNSIRCVSEIMIPKILTATPPHALFMDCTHDNETPFEKRTVEDTFAQCCIGGSLLVRHWICLWLRRNFFHIY